MLRVKICGLTTVEAVRVAAEGGAAYLGFVFFPRSPRAVDLVQAAELALAAPAGPVKVALVVDPDDTLIDAIAELPIDMFQLHGQESPERVAEIRKRTGLPVMKAVGIRDRSDLDSIAPYVHVADQLLIDAKPPEGATRPGGNAISFDWGLIADYRWPIPWLLAGGLTAANVAEAARLTNADQVDVSTGVESAPGVKDPAKIRAFLEAAGC